MRRTRHLSTLATCALALALQAQTALSAVPLSQQGRIGPYVLTDSDTSPGIACTYDAGGPGDMGNDIDLVEARSPRVFARDRSGRRDRQTVGVRILFERSVNEGGSGGWVTAKATKVVKKAAYDDQPARFSRKSWLVPFEEDYQYRVSVVMRWYKPGTTSVVQGSTKLRYVRYQVLQGGPQWVEQDRCLPEP